MEKMVTSLKTPDEILTLIDGAQSYLNDYPFDEGAPYDLRSLMWDVIMDILDTVRNWPAQSIVQHNIRDNIAGSLTDYVTNAYGDD